MDINKTKTKIKYNLDSILKYSIYFLVFALPFQTRWIIQAGELNGVYSEYGTISLYLTDVVVLLALLLVFFKKRLGTKEHLHREDFARWWFIVGVLELIVFVSCFFAPDKIIAFYVYARFLLGIGLFYLLSSFCNKRSAPTEERAGTKNRISKKSVLVQIFLASTFLQSILAIYQSITQSVFANKWLGMAEHLPATLGASVIELADGLRWLRAYGSLDHPNMLGGLMVFAVLLAVFELIKITNLYFRSSKASLTGKGRILNLKTILLLISLTASTITIFLAFSRSAWLATAIGIIALLSLTVIKKELLAQKRILQSVLVASSIFFILFVMLNEQAQTRFLGGTRLEQKSTTERVDANKEAVSVIKENWLFGVGIGNYTQYIQSRDVSAQRLYVQPVHNVFLLIASEIGVVGMLIFVFMIMYIFIHVNIHMNSLLIIPLLVLFLFDHWLWSLHFGVILFWFVLACSLRR